MLVNAPVKFRYFFTIFLCSIHTSSAVEFARVNLKSFVALLLNGIFFLYFTRVCFLLGHLWTHVLRKNVSICILAYFSFAIEVEVETKMFASKLRPCSKFGHFGVYNSRHFLWKTIMIADNIGTKNSPNKNLDKIFRLAPFKFRRQNNNKIQDTQTQTKLTHIKFFVSNGILLTNLHRNVSKKQSPKVLNQLFKFSSFKIIFSTFCWKT